MIPDGYKLVPIEPTEEMKVEGRDYLPATPGGVSPKTAGNVYEAMINAAPQPPNQLNTTPVGEAVYQVLYAHEIGATFEDTDKDTYDKHKGKKRILFTAPIPTITQAHVLAAGVRMGRGFFGSDATQNIADLMNNILAELNPKTAEIGDV